jgi:hypothetical protein
MRLKTELYEKEQYQIIDTIIDILDLQNKKSYTLYELDNNQDIQTRIMNLIPTIRMFFAFNCLKAIGEPERFKRPYLSIIKNLIKNKYKITSKDFKFKKNNVIIRTQLYSFQKYNN